MVHARVLVVLQWSILIRGGLQTTLMRHHPRATATTARLALDFDCSVYQVIKVVAELAQWHHHVELFVLLIVLLISFIILVVLLSCAKSPDTRAHVQARNLRRRRVPHA